MNAAIHVNEGQHRLLQSHENHDMIVVSRNDLETEHRQLLSRIQQLRRLLGYDPLPTGKQQRLAAAK
jgi:hypothetical protein